MASLHSLPACSPPQPAQPALRLAPCRRSEVDVAGVAARLRLAHFEMRTIIAKIRVLVARYGFPAPATPRIVKGRRMTGAAAVYAKSRWRVDEVDAWSDDDTPPAAAARAAGAAREQVRTELAERAKAMVA